FFLTGDRAREAGPRGMLRVALAMRLEDIGLRTGAARSAELLENARALGFRESAALLFATELMRALGKNTPPAAVTLFTQARSDEALQEWVLQRTLATADAGAAVALNRAFEATVDDYQGALAQHDVMVSSRFHGCVLALARG